MNYRPFGSESLKISEVGLGCWQLGGDWGSISDAQAVEILETAVSEGITFFDTADVYGGGKSESLIGDFLKLRSESVFVATKAGRMDIYPDGYTKASVRACITESLTRLQTDSLDLVQMHCIPFEVMKQGDVWAWLNDFVKEGIIKRYGASIESVEEANWCIDNVPDLYSLQVIFNVFRQKPAFELFDKAAANKVGIIVRVPLASGLLSGKFTKDTIFDPSDHRNYNANGEAFNVGETFAGVPFAKGVELASELDRIRNSEVPMAQWALRWILDHPAVSTVIPGASKPAQVISNAGASKLPSIDPAVFEAVNNFYQTNVEPEIRGPY